MKRPNEHLIDPGETRCWETDVARIRRTSNRSERGASLTEAIVATFILGVILSTVASIDPAASNGPAPSGPALGVEETTEAFLSAVRDFEATEAARGSRDDERPFWERANPAEQVVFISESSDDRTWRRVRLAHAGPGVVVLSETRVRMEPEPAAAPHPNRDFEAAPAVVIGLRD